MTKSFYPHLGTIFLVHIMVLMGTWKLSNSEFVRDELQRLSSNVMKLQVASKVMTADVQKKRVVPVNPLKPKTSDKIIEEKSVAIPESSPVASSEGSEVGTASKGKTDLLSIYRAELRAMIEKNKYYPTMSKRLGQTGTVVVAFTLLEDGHIIDVRIEKPSRYDRLNASALDAVKKVERFKPIPKEIGKAKMDVSVPVKFITI